MTAAPAKVTLFDMADMVGRVADRHRHAGKENPLSDGVQETARIWAGAHLTLALMALDEDASRKFIAGLIKAHGHEAKLLIGMLTYLAPKVETDQPEVEAA